MKPPLTVDRLKKAGFEVVGAWQIDDVAIRHGLKLPEQAGVYAFAIDGVVQYVGLASRSIRQRLGFYQRPGASQRTNIRLNELIRARIADGRPVEILLAHPPDMQWNGLRLCGAEGLEAGLIADFDLPWNMRGSSLGVQPEKTATMKFPSRPKQADINGQILEIVRRRPGMTELEIAKKIYGPSALQPQVNPHCRRLLESGLVERRGSGGVGDPFIYYPVRDVDDRN